MIAFKSKLFDPIVLISLAMRAKIPVLTCTLKILVQAESQMSTSEKGRGLNADHLVQEGTNSCHPNHPWLFPIVYYNSLLHNLIMCIKK